MKKSLVLIALSAALPCAVAQDIATGLIGWYRLDGSGTDLSVSVNPLSLNNVQSASDRYGTAGGAVYLDGVSSWMVSAFAPPISGSQARTISVWIKSDDFSFYRGNPVIVGLGDKSGNGTLFDLTLGAPGANAQAWSGVTQAFPAIHGSYLDTVGASSSVNSGEWVHLAVTTGSTQGSTSLYVNGALQPLSSGAYFPYSVPSAVYSTSVSQIRIGTGSVNGGPSNDSYYWWNQGFKGSMDELRIYDRQLSSSEIALLASNPVPDSASPLGLLSLTAALLLFVRRTPACKV